MRVSFYVNRYLSRTENSIFQQLRGLSRFAQVQMIARRGRHLDEFPFRGLFLEEDHRTISGRLRMRIRPRLFKGEENPYRLPVGVARRLARQSMRWKTECLYAVFAWNGMHLLDVRRHVGADVPLVFLAAGSDINAAESLGPYYLDRLEELFETCDLLLAASSFLRDKMIGLGASPVKTIVHYIGVDVPSTIPVRMPAIDGPVRFVVASRLDPVKGVLHSLRSLSKAAPQIGPFRLAILGDGPEMEDARNLVRKLRMEESTDFRGMVSHSEVLREMEISDILLQHNVTTEDGREECLSLSVLEAMARATTPIVTRSGGMPEAVRDGATGCLVTPGDEAEMTEAIVALANDSGRCRSMGLAARKDVRRRFDLESQNRSLADLLSRVADRRVARCG